MKVAAERLYIRPIARIAPAAGARSALVVAGRSDLLFAAAELIERDRGEVRRRIVSAAELRAGGPAPLERLCQPRAAIAGLALDRPLVMGVVNVTPDSFSDGGRYLAPDAAIGQALASTRKAPTSWTSAPSRRGPVPGRWTSMRSCGGSCR
jgi:dihydropteroate synthase